MAPSPYPAGWIQLTNIPEDATALQTAFKLVKDTYPKGQYDHLNVRRLRRKMVCRENTAGDLVLGLRVFWRDGGSTTQKLDMTAFFFARLRQTDETCSLTIGVGSDVPQATITDQIKAISGYMSTQAGGARRLILSVTATPVTLCPQLDAAFSTALLPANGNLVVQPPIPADPPPWPDPYYVWLIQP